MARVSIEDVRKALAAPRPGWEAQLRMAPRRQSGINLPPPQGYSHKEAGVLVLLFERDGELSFVLTRRTDTVAMHKGQISLPGGAREAAESLDETACRESCEELGIQLENIGLFGAALTPLYIGVSDFWVTAFVARWVPFEREPLFRPAAEEVVELIDAPVANLLDDSLLREEEWDVRGEHVIVPFFLFGGNKVWGATAMVLSEFREMLRSQMEQESEEHMKVN